MKSEILGALARGYCTERNKKKVVDPDLIEDMAREVLRTIVREIDKTVEIIIKEGMKK